MTAAVLAQGTLMKIGDGAGNYTTIAEAKNISGPQLTQGAVDVTSHDSANQFREYIAGLRDGGKVTFDINWIPSNATHGFTTGLLKAGFGGTKGASAQQFRIVFPDGATTTWTFVGIVTKLAPVAGIDKELTAAIEIQISGQPTLA